MPTKKTAATPTPKRRLPAVKSLAQPVRKAPAVKPVARPGASTTPQAGVPKKLSASAKAAPSEAPAKEVKETKEPKKLTKIRPRLVRDSFTMPEADFAFIATLKTTALAAQRAAKKSELLRAGLRLLAGLDAVALVAALDALEPVKTGRPQKGH